MPHARKEIEKGHPGALPPESKGGDEGASRPEEGREIGNSGPEGTRGAAGGEGTDP